MAYRTVRKIITPKELWVKGETVGDFLLDLQKKLPVAPLDVVLPNGMKLILGREKVEIKLQKSKEIRHDVIEKIITEGTTLLLEENRERVFDEIDDRRRIKITMSLGDNTIYFTQGHLDRLPDGTALPMTPMLQMTDDTFLRVLDSNFTSDMDTLRHFIRMQHNRTLGLLEEDRTQEVADKLGFTTVEKDDSLINVEINGVTDSCMVTRLCIHSNEFQNEKELLESVIKTYRDILKIGENPLLIIGLSNLIDVTIGRDRKTITIEPYEYHEKIIRKLVNVVIGPIITKDILENARIEYNEKVLIEGESLSYKIFEWLNGIVEAADKINQRYEYEIIFSIALATIPLIFLLLYYSKIDQTNSYLPATIVTITSVIFAVAVTRTYRKSTLVKTFGQKKFTVSILVWSVASYITIDSFGYGTYLIAIFGIIAGAIGYTVITVGLHWAYPHIARLLYPMTRRYKNVVNNIKSKEKKSSKTFMFINDTMEKIGMVLYGILNSYTGKKIWMVLYIVSRIITSILGALAVIIFAIAFLPMIGLFVLLNFLNKGYWKELEEYRENLIEKAVHKYRDQRKLAPSCRVIFKTTQCKRLKNPLSGSWNVLRKKAPRLLTADGFIDLVDKLVLKEWM